MATDTNRVLLHVCCGPCALYPLERLLEEGREVTALFYNPNIHPLQEYLRRREALSRAAERLGVRVIWKDDEYDPKQWFRAVSHREENRCFHCYALRLERTLQIARRGNFDAFSTTLLYSKRQKHEVIRDLARDMAGGGVPTFLYEDWREGWSAGIEQSKEWDLYRQSYCGCLYSENERYQRDLRGAGAGAGDT